MSNNKLLDKLRKNSTIKLASILNESILFGVNEMVKLPVPAFNIAMSGMYDGGLYHGLHMIAGPSKSFKTLMGLIMMKAYMDYYPDSVAMLFDTEFGAMKGYFESLNIDESRVIHVPIMNIEELKFEVVNQLDKLERGERVFMFVDSVGNVASKKELEDALTGSSKADMTRAKQLKSFYRMITPYLNTKEVPMVVINHIYMTQEMYSKPVVSGGSGGIYSSTNIWIVIKTQHKDGDERTGSKFTINIEKSRMVKEFSKIPIIVRLEGGISQFSGFFEWAKEGGYITNPKSGWWTRPCVPNDKNWREADTESWEFWTPVIEKTDFKEYLKKLYTLSTEDLVNAQSLQEEVDDLEEEAE